MDPVAAARWRPSPGERLLEDLAEIGHDAVGAMASKGGCVTVLLDRDDELEVAGTARDNSVGRRLEERGALGIDGEMAAGGEVHVGRRLPAQIVARARLPSMHSSMRVLRCARCSSRRVLVLPETTAHPESRIVCELEIEARAVEGVDPALLEASQQQLLLAICEPVHGLAVGRVGGEALGQADPAAGEECPHRVGTRSAVNECRVVDAPAEGGERHAAAFDAARDEPVEQLLPDLGVELGAGDEDAVDVEHAGLNVRGKAEQLLGLDRRGE